MRALNRPSSFDLGLRKIPPFFRSQSNPSCFLNFGIDLMRLVPSFPRRFFLLKTGQYSEGQSSEGMHRFGIRGLKSRISQGANAVSDTYFSIKDVFERHKVVLTLAASIASAGAAWAGYTARQLHQQKVEQRLNTIEHVMKTVHNLEERQVKELTNSGVSFTSCAATAGTTLVIGYGLGWRGGRWYTIKKAQRQQQKLLAPKRSTITALRKRFAYLKRGKGKGEASETLEA